MTEAEWMRCADPHEMLDVFRDREPSPDRKLRLFTCASRRRITDRLPHDSDRAAIEEMERTIEQPNGAATLDRREREAGGEFFSRYLVCYWNPDVASDLCHDDVSRAFNAAICSAVESVFAIGGEMIHSGSDSRYTHDDEGNAEMRAHVALVHDIFGNPFRPVAFSPAWRTDTAVSLARQMYESREFSAMPILADALQDAGCDNEEILAHCRDANATHVRGCWVVDLVLGKE